MWITFDALISKLKLSRLFCIQNSFSKESALLYELTEAYLPYEVVSQSELRSHSSLLNFQTYCFIALSSSPLL